ncbi:RNA polymerase sigma factor [Simiduia litorea]|uniref:RNA polymerase sigma factor n=1 Tax=Simiduia litorea TaxID=1435348 RepID=UPI0036F1C1A7
MTDNNLIKAAQAGDRQAFSRLVEGQYDLMFRCAMKWCGVKADAEDITQQACIKLARSLGQFRFESAFETWLYRLVINCAKDWQQVQGRHQRRRTYETPEQPLLDQQPAANENPEASVFLLSVLAWIAQMGEGFKEAVLLVLGEGLNHKEAAEVLQVKESTVSWRLHEVRKRLKLWHAEGGVSYERP